MDELVRTLVSTDSAFALFAAIFLYLYWAEKKAHTVTQQERISDLKLSMESVHKSVGLLDAAMVDIRRGP